MEQRTSEWFEERLGKATASKISDIVSKTKTGYSATRSNYAAQLIIERLTGQQAESYTNAAMQWGVDTEAQARAAYELSGGLEVEEAGFIPHPVIEMSGASPDGLIGDDGLVEIKCPNSATHVDFLLNPTIEKKYFCQMQWQMACTRRKWCDFVSFDPRLPINLQLKTVRVNRDNEAIEELEQEVSVFLAEVAEKVEKLRGLQND